MGPSSGWLDVPKLAAMISVRSCSIQFDRAGPLTPIRDGLLSSACQQPSLARHWLGLTPPKHIGVHLTPHAYPRIPWAHAHIYMH
eukprot:4143711-Alexandrium_andersonii.AAC.1